VNKAYSTRNIVLSPRALLAWRAKIRTVIGPFLWILVLSSLALAQQNNQQQTPPPPQQDQSSTQQQSSRPLFKNKLGYKSSSTSKESTTLGFNGIDPSGKVDQKMMATTPTGADQEKVKKMSASQPTPADIKAFVQEGGLASK
jgi:hypothetical protein